MNKETESTTVSRSWLEILATLQEEVLKDVEEWQKTDKPLMPKSVYKLAGFASSAKPITKFKK